MKFGCRNTAKKGWAPDRIWSLTPHTSWSLFYFTASMLQQANTLEKWHLMPSLHGYEHLLKVQWNRKFSPKILQGVEGRKKGGAYGARADVLLQILQDGLGKYHFPSACYHTPAQICRSPTAEPHSCTLPMLLVCFRGSSDVSSNSWLCAEANWELPLSPLAEE